MKKLNVYSEIGRLRRVLVRRPGDDFELLTPLTFRSMLFDDIVYLPRLQEEHDAMTSCLRRLGVEVVDLNSLLMDVLKTDKAKHILRARMGSKSSLRQASGIVASMLAEELFEYVVTGRDGDGTRPELLPLINTIFPRDLGIVAGEKFISINAYKVPRKGEGRLVRELFIKHPDFFGNEIVTPNYGRHTLEGGDVHVLSPKVVCIGVSERTKFAGAKVLINELHALGFENVIIVDMYKNRRCMHLDTIMTMVDHGHFLIYKPMILDRENEHFCEATIHRPGEKIEKVPEGLSKALESCGISFDYTMCGGTDITHQRREQWTDGTNALTVAPGQFILYDRNVRTIAELQNRGYEVVRVEDVTGPFDPAKKVVMTTPSCELSRGRGGPHCLSMPLYRD